MARARELTRWQRWTRTKSVAEVAASAERSGLRRELGPVHLVFLGVGAMIGAGIFTAVDRGASLAGPAVVLSYSIAGIACVFAAFCYGELAAAIPGSGSAYSYTFVTLGQLMAWLVAWNLVAEFIVGNMAVASVWSNNLELALENFGLDLPRALTAAPGDPGATGGVFDLPAFLIVMAVTALLTVGVRESARANLVLSFLKVGALFLFIVLAVGKVDTSLWRPFSPEGTGGVFAAAAVVFFAFIGFDTVAAAAEESRNPKRDLPIGIIGSLALVTAFYIVVSLLYVGLVPADADPSGAALAEAIRSAGYTTSIGGVSLFDLLIALGAIAATTSVLLVFQLGIPRILLAVARDGMLPAGLAKVHPRFATPARLTLITGTLTAIGAATVPFGTAIDFTNLATLFVFVVVSLAVLALRKKEPDLQRPFRVRAAPLVVLAAVVSLGALMLSLDAIIWLYFGAWMGLGLVLYGVYGATRD